MPNLPKEVKCDACGAVGRFTICTVCSTPTPEAAAVMGIAEAWYDGRLPDRDEEEDDQFLYGGPGDEDEDHSLDDPRHGQARDINRGRG